MAILSTGFVPISAGPDPIEATSSAQPQSVAVNIEFEEPLIEDDALTVSFASLQGDTDAITVPALPIFVAQGSSSLDFEIGIKQNMTAPAVALLTISNQAGDHTAVDVYVQEKP